MSYRRSFAVFLLAGFNLGLIWPVGHATAQDDAAPRFVFPAGCEIGQDCWFFAYMDHDPSDRYRDHMGGVRTYEAHKGTDIAPTDPLGPVAVIAAADGVVLGVRDGMDDSLMRVHDETRMAAQCGNGVRIDHGAGWTSQYCHLQRDSVAVRTGTHVIAGQLLGWVGSSGNSNFRHLHFQVERNGRPVDPFDGATASTPPQGEATGAANQPLWKSAEAREISDYTPLVIYRAGIATGAAEQDRALYEGYPDTASVSVDALVGYIVLLGVSDGTTVDTLITGPGGQRLFENRRTLDQDAARAFSFAGTRRKVSAWAPGEYQVRFVVAGEGPTGDFELQAQKSIVLE
ncbi:MAG: M23 family metallopeptidase [Rhodospirillaceae bacterium]|nr:M23 family metallopeptidase [Rhodospirillaceae bacterium]MBT3810641.1 M23 family metallopeptidase [Rhodospirillaceae bacterium]MBT3930267.1 M23 family metallopeptidase [Rhodospirillaceae bacterium]MBT4773388.1 M23 family metallopeptidase [Rhodospirillaceae bacterium]MBT5359772.1 M23 family metallopeptidase [Rhodospirillaceae bacterium]